MLHFLKRLLSKPAPPEPPGDRQDVQQALAQQAQAEDSLRQSEAYFDHLTASVTDYAIFKLDPEGRVASWNAGAERIKGYKPAEIIGQHFSRFYPPDALARNWPATELERARTEGRFEDEGWRLRKDGSRFWANVVITALKDKRGNLQGFTKVTRDLTERKRAEEALQQAYADLEARVQQRTHELTETNARLHAEIAQRTQVEADLRQERERLAITLASIGDGVIVTDAQGRITFVNLVAEGLLGWRQEEAAAQPLSAVFRIVNEQTRQPVEDPVAKVFASGVICGLANHTVLIARDGSERPIDDSGAPIKDEHGKIQGVVLVFRDVSERRKAEEARQRLAAIVNSSEDAIIGKSLDGIITTWNRGAEHLYGYSAAEVVGKPMTLLVPPDHPDEMPAILERIKRGETIEHLETERVRKDGRRIVISASISPIRNEAGHIVGASKIARDITADKEAERERQHLIAKLREADERKNEFLAMLAHELRNPLAPVRNGLQILKMPAADDATLRQVRAMMERQVQQLVRLVDDLLDVSRIMENKIELRKTRIDLAAVIERAIETAQPTIDAQGHELSVTLPPQPIQLEGDLIRLAQVIGNLLMNAAKYTDHAGRIWLSAERSDGTVAIRVRDEGIGIAPELLPRVFDLFVQADRSLARSQGGLGIGLTLVKRLVELHGGSVSAASGGARQGSEFTVRLPILTEVPAPEDGQALPPAQAPGPHRRVLVVDDNVDAAESVALLLRMFGHNVQMAFDGPSALEAVKAHRPEILLLDIGLPGMNGYDVTRLLRAQAEGRSLFIIAMTGYGQDEDRYRSQAAGFDWHFTKPVDPHLLQSAIAAPDAFLAAHG